MIAEMDYFSCVSGSIWVYILWCVHVSVVMCLLVYGVSKKESVGGLDSWFVCANTFAGYNI